MNAEALNRMDDDELRDVAKRATDLLAQRDVDRKDQARAAAMATLAAAGLKPADLVAKPRGKNRIAAPTYHAGRTYTHPDNPELRWNGRGVRPKWIKELEAAGRRPASVMT